VCDLAAQPYDLLPPMAEAKPNTPAPAANRAGESTGPEAARKFETPNKPGVDVQTTAWMQSAEGLQRQTEAKPKIMPPIPPEVPGSETPLLHEPAEAEARQRERERLYPPLPPLPTEPRPLPGPNGKPYTLAELQQLAAANCPTVRQAAADVEAARGNLIQSRAYPNPTVGWSVQPSNDGSTAGLQGPFIDQTIKFGGKLKWAAASAEMDFQNAGLALRRARSDLSTSVRNAYFALLVARESVRVNRALASFTDEIYRLHVVGELRGIGRVAVYEPAALRAQAYSTRLAYRQSIQTYIYSWKLLVAAIGLRQLPLTEVAGRIDAAIPYYDYDAVLAHAQRNHTDVLIARNGIEKAKYNLNLARITPYPDVDVNVGLLKEYALAPKQFVHTLTVGVPFPVWDRNQGNIMAAEAALVRATEEPHRVAENLTATLATAYTAYKQNLDALEYYRRMILPDQVTYYRGVLQRRQIDPGASFGDLVTAQQTLATNVTSYLGILGSLWSSVVSVADVLQTDDLFQLAKPQPVPPVPDLDGLSAWPCCHDCPATGGDAHSKSERPAALPDFEHDAASAPLASSRELDPADRKRN
jgi:cobalt-zinc-cadmium efflux system outer membrane protein